VIAIVTWPTLRVTSTTFALPGNAAWEPLARLGELDFGAFNDWPQALLAPEPRPLIWLLFLEDVLAPESLPPVGAIDLEQALGPLLSALATRLERVAAPLVLAWSGWRPASPIAAARRRPPWQQLTHDWDERLYQLAERYPNLHLLALDPLLGEPGWAVASDARNYYAARCRLSRRGLAATAAAIAAVLERIRRPPHKVLVLDCDNTLWGGVVGEVGLAGLTLGSDGPGQAFHDFQRAARQWAQQGVLLALASKNQPDDVWQVFDQHPGMVLQRRDLAAWRIDWRDKALTLAELADELGLGLDSLVFWDDNPLEREKMRAAAPAVATIEVPAAVSEWPRLLARLDLLARFAVTEEDRHKGEQYRSRAAFLAEQRLVTDEAQFLRSLDLKPGRLPLGPATLARAQQLCAKTNQFNLRGLRHSAAELEQLAQRAGEAAFLVTLSDRFGDHGLIGLAIALKDEDAPAEERQERVAVLDSFLLSCRVLGRQIEAWMLDQLAQALRRQGCRWLVAPFHPGERNAMAAGFLPDHGLVPAAAAGPLPPAVAAVVARHAAAGPVYLARLETLTVPHLDGYAPC